MKNISVQDCKVISLQEEEKSFIITIGSEIIFINNNAYKHSGKITSILPNGFYVEDNMEFVQWDQIADIVAVNNGVLLNNLINIPKIEIDHEKVKEIADEISQRL